MVLLYAKELKPFARQLRNNMTPQEEIVWKKIRLKQIHGIQFFRQKPIGRFIVDFYAKCIKLAIEIDGSQHYTAEGKACDMERDAYLFAQGVTILRFGNHAVNSNLNVVLDRIGSTVLHLKNLPPPGF